MREADGDRNCSAGRLRAAKNEAKNEIFSLVGHTRLQVDTGAVGRVVECACAVGLI